MTIYDLKAGDVLHDLLGVAFVFDKIQVVDLGAFCFIWAQQDVHLPLIPERDFPIRHNKTSLGFTVKNEMLYLRAVGGGSLGVYAARIQALLDLTVNANTYHTYMCLVTKALK
jgi:hypothetical protein